uniref:Immunoglobulin domain-containing protein n=1 Tax=Echeneis naucrates TaxID=173247 RepID=A0A665U036_ECHNA
IGPLYSSSELCCWLLLLFVLPDNLLSKCCLFASTGQHDVICPPQPIQTEEGETVSIRCRLNQTVDLQDEMISVSRPNLNEEVISYRDGKDHSEDNADSNRFSLNHEDLKGGILNLQISSVQLSDRGLYTVYIRGRNVPFNVTLDVGKTDSFNAVNPGECLWLVLWVEDGQIFLFLLCFIFLQVQRRWMFLLWSEVFLVLLFLCSLLLESCGNVEESVSSKVLLFNISSVLWSLICL